MLDLLHTSYTHSTYFHLITEFYKCLQNSHKFMHTKNTSGEGDGVGGWLIEQLIFKYATTKMQVPFTGNVLSNIRLHVGTTTEMYVNMPNGTPYFASTQSSTFSIPSLPLLHSHSQFSTYLVPYLDYYHLLSVSSMLCQISILSSPMWRIYYYLLFYVVFNN